MAKHKTLEQNCEGFAPKSNRQCIVTGYFCDKEDKYKCDYFKFIQYRLSSQQFKNYGRLLGND